MFKLGRYQNILNGTQPSTTPTALQPYRRMLMALGWAWHVQAAHQSSGMIAFGSRSTSRACGCRTAVMSNLSHAAVRFSFFLFFFYIFMTTRAACFSVMRIVAPGQRRVHQKTHETLALASASAWLPLSMRRVSGVVLIFFTSLCGRPPHNKDFFIYRKQRASNISM